MNILIYTNGFGTNLKNLYGPMSELFVEIANQGHRLFIVTREDLVDLNSIPINDNILLHTVTHEKGIKKFLTLKKLYDTGEIIIKENNIDIVYSHILPYLGIVASRLSSKHNIRYFSWLCGDGREQAKSSPLFYRVLSYMFYYYIHKSATKMMTGCNWVAKEQSEPLGMNYKDKYVISPNSVKIDRFSNQTKSYKDKFSNTNPIVIYSSRITYRKGFDLFLDSVVELLNEKENFNVIICGGGNEQDVSMLNEKIKSNNLENKIWYAGNIESKDLPNYLQSADIFCVPARYQGFSRAYIEAMASGCTVVTTPAGCTPEIVENGVTGLIVEPNISDIKQGLKKVLNDENLRKTFVSNSTNYVQKYSVESVAKRYIEIFNEN
jgi:glycosyltransferase involved in cell wall biosynthesis